MGRKIVLTGTTLTDTSAPRLAVVDPIESTGSLLLIDPAHPVNPWDAGLPATVPNLFASVLSTGPTAALGVTGGIDNGTKGKIERSTKGGLHSIVSQANALADGDGVRITPPSSLTTYLTSHTTNDYYTSLWYANTRADLGPDGCYFYTMCSSYAHGDGLGSVNSLYWPGTSDLGKVDPSFALGNHRIDRGTGAFRDSPETAALAMWVAGAPTGTVAGTTTLASRNNTWPSMILYRVYIEDLTVSGRSYATVSALDAALYTKEVLTPGGRYYGDTFTDPTTIP